MILTLYTTNDAENVLNKTLTNSYNISMNFKADVNIETPSLLLSKITGVDYEFFNYCFIDGFNRFYFIRSISPVNAGLFRIELETDYLESFKSDVLAATGMFRKRLDVGDYGQLEINSTGRTIIEEYPSNVEVEPENVKILTGLRWEL